MSKLDDLVAQRRKVEDEIVRLADIETLSKSQDEHFHALVRERDGLSGKIEDLRQRAERVEKIKNNVYREYPGAPEMHTAANSEATTNGLRALDRIGDYFADTSAQERAERLVRSDPSYGHYIDVHSTDVYASAWSKVMQHTDAGILMSDAERQAMNDSWKCRAMGESATTQGGFAVPVFIDPSVILSDMENDNPFLRLCNIVDVTTSQWKGVSAAGVSWSFDVEASEVSDDSITLAQPTVTVNMARGFVASIEIIDDWSGFVSEMGRLLSTGYDELLLDKFTRGSGTNEPRGLLTALDANTNVQVVSTTDGAFGQEDIYKTWEALPAKFRRKASWMASTTAMDRVRQMGSATAWHAVTVQLPAGAVDVLFNRPVVDNVYFPDIGTLTTGAQDRMVVGDFNTGMVIARRAGMSVEVVPMLFSPSNQRPTFQRGYAAWARIGANVVLDTAFRVQRNT